MIGKGKDLGKPPFHKDKKKKKIKCFYCNKVGHIQNECIKHVIDEKNATLNPIKKESTNKYNVDIELFNAIEEIFDGEK